MARNMIESDFRSLKMEAGGHFVKQIKLGTDLKLREMHSPDRFLLFFSDVQYSKVRY